MILDGIDAKILALLQTNNRLTSEEIGRRIYLSSTAVAKRVKKLRESGSPEVAFRVAVKDGKVNFTARAMKGTKE